MGLHDFSIITAQMLAPAHTAKCFIMKWRSDVTQRCSKDASEQARLLLNYCQTCYFVILKFQ